VRINKNCRFRLEGTIVMRLFCLFCLLSIAVLLPSGVADAAQCDDLIDNNANGPVDLTDWYCKSPDDNDEGSFYSAVSGDDANAPAALDCWFDTDSGSGNDGCSIHACCGIDGACPQELDAAQFDPNQCVPSESCTANCQPLAKAGCDCFGCCEICTPETGCLDVFVNPVVSPSCSMENLGDPNSCRRCVQNTGCLNPARIFANGFEVAAPVVEPLARILERATR
jgi:hypothetical protein